MTLDLQSIQAISIILSLFTYQLGVKQKHNVWIVNIFITLFNTIVYYKTELYHRLIIAGTSIIYSLYGWYKWRYGGEDNTTLQVTRTSISLIFILLLLGLTGVFILYFFLGGIHATHPLMGAIRTSFTWVGLWMTTHKKLESYILWFLLNLISIYLSYQGGLTIFALKFVFYLGFSVQGYMAWRKSFYNIK